MAIKWAVAIVVLGCAVAIWTIKPKRLLLTENLKFSGKKIRGTDDQLGPEYDYLIVGAGAAGSALAVRLSEDPKVTVALFEAGPNNEKFPELDTPLCYPGMEKSDIDWNFRTVPQEHACFSIEDQRAPITRGKVLGGTSSLNSMLAVRGSQHDFDQWAAMGNKGWSYKDVLPYFKKLESYKSTGYRGGNGPVEIRDTNPYDEATNAFIEAAQMQGFKIGDVNAEEMNNRVMKAQTNVGTSGERQGAAEAYLGPLKSRPNLHVKTNSQVISVMLEGNRATGLYYMNEQMKKVRVRKEVILAAGSIGSAQMLMLTGIGPKEHLKKMGIPVVVDLPVGKNLHDHVAVQAAAVTLDKPVSFLPERLGPMDKLEYQIFGTGVYSHGGPIATAFSRSKHQPDSHKNPYLQYVLMNNMLNSEIHRNNIDMKSDVHDVLYGGLDGRDGLNLLVSLQKPASVGDVKLDTTLSFDAPLINPNYLAEEVDVDILLDGIRTARKIMSSSPLANKLGAKLVDRVHPNCTNEKYDSDEYWKCYIRCNTLSFSHPTSTCRMGPDGDANSVVDTKLRVRAMRDLRVVDASVMPTIPSGNTDFAVMMIAERAADIIKGKI